MDVIEALTHRLEVRDYADEPVDGHVVRTVLDAARLSPSGKNHQHWRFVVIEGDDLGTLAQLSTTGTWITDAAFAVVVCTDPTLSYHQLDAGRAITHMQLAAWAHGVGSCIYTGFDDAKMHEFLAVPEAYDVTAVVGFGYPAGTGRGRKNRNPLSAVAFQGRFGEPYGTNVQ